MRHDLLREDAKTLIEEVSDALLVSDDAKAEQKLRVFQDCVVEAIDDLPRR